MAFTDGPQVPRHFIQTKYIYYKPKNSHRPLCSHLRPRCSHPYAEGRNEARCLVDGVRGHSHFLGPDCYSAASSNHTLAACGAVGAAIASGVRSEYSTHKALLCSSASIVTVVTEGPHTLTGRAPPLPAATATAAGLLTKVCSDLDAACGAVGAAVASSVRGEYTRSAPPFVRFHSHRGDRGATRSHRACAAAASCNCYSYRAAHQSWQ